MQLKPVLWYQVCCPTKTRWHYARTVLLTRLLYLDNIPLPSKMQRRIEPHCECRINVLLCEFVLCSKGQRWIVQVVHMCKPYRLGLILTLDLKLSIHGRSRRCGWSVTQLGGTCAFVHFNHTNNIILETYRLHQTPCCYVTGTQTE